jgi:Putative DNA-binding domain
LRRFRAPRHNEAMLWEGRPLRDIREIDVRRLLESGLEEHLQLEYKSALYEDNDRGRREFLLDVCMFANASGGILLIGVTERRDEQGQPTGAPDPTGALGLEVPNPEAVLNAYDARVMEAIEERLPLEAASIDVGQGRRLLAIRVPNSAGKPHSVRHQGHIYFPSRRERQRYHLTVREIKELVMRTTSRLQQAEEMLESSFLGVARAGDPPYLIIGMIPVFFEDFLVDVRADNVRLAVGNFSRAGHPEYGNPIYTFDGIERREARFEYTVRFRRNGLLNVSLQLPLIPRQGEHQIGPAAVDILLRQFVSRAGAVYQAAAIGAPYVLGMMLRMQQRLTGVYPAAGGGEEHTAPVPAGDYRFPYMQLDDLSSTDRIIRPFCDQAHQMFGRDGSPSFNAEGVWVARYL